MFLFQLVASIVFIFAILAGQIVVVDMDLLAFILLSILVSNSVYFLYKFRRNNIICFELFFFLAFLLATFQYPLLENQLNDYASRMFFSISDNLFIKGISIASLGYLFYLFGAFLPSKTNGGKIRNDNSHLNIKKLGAIFNYLTLITFTLIMSLGGYSLIFQYSEQNQDRWAGAGALWDYLWLFFIISSVLEFIRLERVGVKNMTTFLSQSEKVYLFIAFLNISFLLISGYRSELMFIMLPLLILYSIFIRKIKLMHLLIAIIIVFFVFNIVGEARDLTGGLLKIDNILNSKNKFSDISSSMRDFLPANGALYNLIDYSDRYGITWGSNILFQVIAIIPFSQTIFINIFNINPGIYSSIIYTTNLSGSNYTSGLGTHIVGDLYYTFGLFGVLVFMFALGYGVSLLYNKILIKKSNNIYSLIAFTVLFGNSLYSVRVEYFYIARAISLSIIIVWLFSSLFRNKNRQIV